MPLLEYVLLAVIGSSGVAGLPATSVASLGPEAIVQPNGGALLPEPQIGIRKSRHTMRKDRNHKHRHSGRRTPYVKKDAGKKS